ncbi:MAG: methylated-DNA--[protein]-cysteine S-methyltransferase [Myxococcales bacterium]|nr:methylated-DNA--[protein]-cysteine S-methyltransferase [Myxococcales bacterium]
MLHRFSATLQSPLGPIRCDADERAVVGVYLPDARGVPAPGEPAPARPLLAQALAELADYFAGRRRAFTFPCAAAGTPFEREVWAALAAIPFGARRSYGELARALGRPGAARAVGSANGRNPLAIVVPCHRVIGGDGALRGYAGGLWAKRWLLDFEGVS